MYRCECEAGFRGVDCEVDIQVCNITSETGENRYIDGWIDSKGVFRNLKGEWVWECIGEWVWE